MFSEKPLTSTSAEAAEIEKLAAEKGKILGVFQCRRWDGDYLTVKKLIESNKVLLFQAHLLHRVANYKPQLGPVSSYEAFYDFYRPPDVALERSSAPSDEVHWKDDPAQNGGGIYAVGTHTIDQVYCLFGFPDKILGRFWGVRDNGVDDCV